MAFQLLSPAFASGAAIPRQHTGDGEDQSPPLRWSEPPAGTQSLALICDDPDAPSPDPWVHWVLYRLPPELRELPEGIPQVCEWAGLPQSHQGHNSWTGLRGIGYRGPAPPPGKTHHYHFRLYALDAELPPNNSLDKQRLLRAMDGHVLGVAELVGTYRR